jgi:hypothetical protein
MRLGKVHNEGAATSELRTECLETAIVDHTSVVNQEHPLAEAGNIREIMGGEKDGDPTALVQMRKRVTDSGFRHEVKTDRRLVQEEDLWVMNEGRGQVTSHALPE